jgi:RNA polymerase sigma-70 factor (ECF subfamily)
MKGVAVAQRPGQPDATGALDPESAAWLRALRGSGAERDAAVGRLHGLLLRIALREARRRGERARIAGPELDDIAHQATADAVVAILAKLDRFRGESRFTTWAYKFVVLETAAKVGRHFWREPTASLDAENWDRLPDRFGLDPGRQSEWRELLDALRDAIDTELTERQRAAFVAIVLNGVPLDAVVAKLDTNRNAAYKTLFDARRKLRAALDAGGYLDREDARRA